MLRNSLKAGKPFKSPMDGSKRNSDSNPNPNANAASTYAKLVEKEKQLDEEIKTLTDDNISEDELKDYIELLHKYNEYKDLAQTIMGQIAFFDGVSVKAVADRFGAPTETDNN